MLSIPRSSVAVPSTRMSVESVVAPSAGVKANTGGPSSRKTVRVSELVLPEVSVATVTISLGPPTSAMVALKLTSFGSAAFPVEASVVATPLTVTLATSTSSVALPVTVMLLLLVMKSGSGNSTVSVGPPISITCWAPGTTSTVSLPNVVNEPSTVASAVMLQVPSMPAKVTRVSLSAW